MSDYEPTPEQVEAAARAIDPSAWRLRDSGTFPLDHPASTSVVIDSQKKATAALTAAGPLIERAASVTAEQRDEAIHAASRALTKLAARQWPGDGLIHDAIPFELADAAVRRALESLGITVARGEGS